MTSKRHVQKQTPVGSVLATQEGHQEPWQVGVSLLLAPVLWALSIPLLCGLWTLGKLLFVQGGMNNSPCLQFAYSLSRQCLYVNIYTEAGDKNRPLSVLDVLCWSREIKAQFPGMGASRSMSSMASIGGKKVTDRLSNKLMIQSFELEHAP